MRKFILTICFIWGVVCLLVAIGVSNHSGFGFWLAIFYLGLFIGPVMAVITGIIGARKYKTLWIPAFLNGLGTLIVALIMQFEFLTFPTILASFLITFIAALVTYGVMRVRFSRPVFSLPLKVLLSVFLIILLYRMAAYISLWAYSPLNEDIFWKEMYMDENKFGFQPIPQTEEEIKGASLNVFSREYSQKYILMDRAGTPFTGVIPRYSYHLKLSLFPPTTKGANYYKNGFLWGESEDRNAETVYPPFYDKDIKNMSLEESYPPYYIHKDYNKNALKTLKNKGEYIVVPTNDPAMKYLLAFDEQEQEVQRLRVNYHLNGMIQSVEFDHFLILNEDRGWIEYNSNVRMDQLGYLDSWSDLKFVGLPASAAKWRKKDFIYIDSIPDPVTEGEAKGMEKEKLVDILLYPRKVFFQREYEWKEEERVLHNLVDLYGWPRDDSSTWTVQFIVDDKERYNPEMTNEHKRLLYRILADCQRITTRPDFESNWREDDFYVQVLDTTINKSIFLHYKDGAFVMRNKFYCFPIDNPEDREIINLLIRTYNPQSVKETDSQLLW